MDRIVRPMPLSSGKTAVRIRLIPLSCRLFFESRLSRRSLFRLFDDPQIRLQRLPAFRKFLLGFLVGDRRNDDGVVSVLPVHRRSNLVLRREWGARIPQTEHGSGLIFLLLPNRNSCISCRSSLTRVLNRLRGLPLILVLA